MLDLKTSFADFRKLGVFEFFLLHWLVSQYTFLDSRFSRYLNFIIFFRNVVIVSRLLYFERPFIWIFKRHLTLFLFKSFSDWNCVHWDWNLFFFILTFIFIGFFLEIVRLNAVSFLYLLRILGFSFSFHHFHRVKRLCHSHWVSSFERGIDRLEQSFLIFDWYFLCRWFIWNWVLSFRYVFVCFWDDLIYFQLLFFVFLIKPWFWFALVFLLEGLLLFKSQNRKFGFQKIEHFLHFLLLGTCHIFKPVGHDIEVWDCSPLVWWVSQHFLCNLVFVHFGLDFCV